MKFFTIDRYRRWYDDGIYDSEDLRVWEDYQAHLEQLRSIVPKNVIELDSPDGIDDGLLVRVAHDREAKRIRLVLRCGDLQMGYYDLDITYEGASISPEHDRVLAEIARTTKSDGEYQSDVYRHELDNDGERRIVHRLCFHPGIWFEIHCDSLEFKRTPRPNRSFARQKDRYPGGPQSVAG